MSPLIRTFILVVLLSSTFSDAQAADFTPLKTNIPSPDEEANNSPLSFKVIGHFPQEYAQQVEFDENRKLAFLSFIQPQQSGIRIIDLSHPEFPKEISTYRTENQYPRAVAASNGGPRLYVLTNQELQIVNTENPSLPKILGTYPVRGDDSRIVGISDAKDRIYLYETSQLTILDVKEAGAPKELGHIRLNGRFEALYVLPTDQFAFFASNKALYSVNIKNPKKPKIVASMPIVSTGAYGNIGPITASDDGKLIAVGDFDQFSPESANLRLVQFDLTRNLSAEDRTLSLNARAGYGLQMRNSGKKIYLMSPEDGLIEMRLTDQHVLELVGIMHVPMAKQIGTFGSGDFYVTKDEKFVFVPITVRPGENIATIGGLTIYGRDLLN